MSDRRSLQSSFFCLIALACALSAMTLFAAETPVPPPGSFVKRILGADDVLEGQAESVGRGIEFSVERVLRGNPALEGAHLGFPKAVRTAEDAASGREESLFPLGAGVVIFRRGGEILSLRAGNTPESRYLEPTLKLLESRGRRDEPPVFPGLAALADTERQWLYREVFASPEVPEARRLAFLRELFALPVGQWALPLPEALLIPGVAEPVLNLAERAGVSDLNISYIKTPLLMYPARGLAPRVARLIDHARAAGQAPIARELFEVLQSEDEPYARDYAAAVRAAYGPPAPGQASLGNAAWVP